MYGKKVCVRYRKLTGPHTHTRNNGQWIQEVFSVSSINMWTHTRIDTNSTEIIFDEIYTKIMD